MKKLSKNNKIQITLAIIGFVLIIVTYFGYPRFIQKKTLATQYDTPENLIEETQDTSLTNVEYKAFTNDGSPYIIQAELAEIDQDDPDIVYMTSVRATFSYKDGRIVVITSYEAKFNKFSGDISFKKNVQMIDSDENKLTSQNLDMLISKNHAAAYEDVKLFTKNGQFLITDKIIFDAIKKTFKISMLEKEKKVKLKLIK